MLANFTRGALLVRFLQLAEVNSTILWTRKSRSADSVKNGFRMFAKGITLHANQTVGATLS